MRVTARAAGAPPGHGVILCSQPCPAWPEAVGGTGSGVSRCPLSVPHTRGSPGITAGSPSWAAPGAGGRGSVSFRLRQLPGRGSTGRGISTRPGDKAGDPEDLSRVTAVSVQANAAAGAAPGMPLRIHGLLPPGMFARWLGGRLGDREGTGGFFLTLTQDPKACQQPRAGGGGDAGPCQRSCPALLRVGEAELRQEC